MNSAIYSGRIMHTRHIPKPHSFSYPFFMWYLDLEEAEQGIQVGNWFSSTRRALSRFLRSDYLGSAEVPLADAVRAKMEQLTQKTVEGKIFGLMNLRTLGLYFSPVNFYYGFNGKGEPTHFLAEVSNIPWNERHYYAHLLEGSTTLATNPKEFKVSPFNPQDNQTYTWKITAPGEQLRINLGLSDSRGDVFEASLHLSKNPFTAPAVKTFLRQIPLMTLYIVTRIYYQALRLFLKGVPYISYTKEEP